MQELQFNAHLVWALSLVLGREILLNDLRHEHVIHCVYR